MRSEPVGRHSLHAASDIQLKVLESLVHPPVWSIVNGRKGLRHTTFPEIYTVGLLKTIYFDFIFGKVKIYAFRDECFKDKTFTCSVAIGLSSKRLKRH